MITMEEEGIMEKTEREKELEVVLLEIRDKWIPALIRDANDNEYVIREV